MRKTIKNSANEEPEGYSMTFAAAMCNAGLKSWAKAFMSAKPPTYILLAVGHKDKRVGGFRLQGKYEEGKKRVRRRKNLYPRDSLAPR